MTLITVGVGANSESPHNTGRNLKHVQLWSESLDKLLHCREIDPGAESYT